MRLMVVVVVLASVLSIALFAWVSIERAQDQRDLDALAARNCMSIEALKTQFREQAIEGYQNLERDARLLGVVLTPELRQAAVESRDKKLARFAAREC